METWNVMISKADLDEKDYVCWSKQEASPHPCVEAWVCRDTETPSLTHENLPSNISMYLLKKMIVLNILT